MDRKNKIFTIIGATAFIAAAGIGGLTLFAAKDGATNTPRASTSQPVAATVAPSASSTDVSAAATPDSSSASASSTATTSRYKDGSYTASNSYRVPHGGQNTISATVTISGGKITAVKATNDYTDGESAMYTDSFSGAVSSDASGQDIASYSPSHIGGASLTTAAFDNVLDSVRSQATA